MTNKAKILLRRLARKAEFILLVGILIGGWTVRLGSDDWSLLAADSHAPTNGEEESK
jgi:hypothetical protein